MFTDNILFFKISVRVLVYKMVTSTINGMDNIIFSYCGISGSYSATSIIRTIKLKTR
jgi:hypothetical protein